MFHSFSEILEIMCTILDVMGWFWSPTKVIKFTLYFSLTSVTIWCAFRCQYHWILVTMYVSETEAEQSAVWPQPWGKFSSNHRHSISIWLQDFCFWHSSMKFFNFLPVFGHFLSTVSPDAILYLINIIISTLSFLWTGNCWAGASGEAMDCDYQISIT